MFIGSAVNLSKRLTEHFIYSKSNEHLQRALALYGLARFKIQILEFPSVFLIFAGGKLCLPAKIKKSPATALVAGPGPCDQAALRDREQYYLNWLFSQVCRANVDRKK
jgi:hypothetical protein